MDCQFNMLGWGDVSVVRSDINLTPPIVAHTSWYSLHWPVGVFPISWWWCRWEAQTWTKDPDGSHDEYKIPVLPALMLVIPDLIFKLPLRPSGSSTTLPHFHHAISWRSCHCQWQFEDPEVSISYLLHPHSLIRSATQRRSCGLTDWWLSHGPQVLYFAGERECRVIVL